MVFEVDGVDGECNAVLVFDDDGVDNDFCTVGDPIELSELTIIKAYFVLIKLLKIKSQ